MKFLLILTASAGLLSAQSNPSWWKYVPPESASIVGIQWKAVQTSLFASAVAAELAPGGSLGFPDLPLLRTPEQILISSPSMLTIEYGTFPIGQLREQAAAKGLKKVAFKNAELWLSSDPAVKSVAYIQEKLLLVGSRQAIEDTINRLANAKERAYSPLLARAARYSKEDLWVVASSLPDPLASLFLPIEIEATAFEGSVSAWDGLHMVAAVERATPMKALDFADSLAQSLASRPAMAEGTEITTRDRSVLIRMDLDEEQLSSSMKVPLLPPNAPADPHSFVTVASAPVKPQPKAFVPPTPVVTAATAPAAPAIQTLSATIPEVTIAEATPQAAPQINLPPAPPRPRVIKILGLESGPLEIPLGN